jgi:integrase
MRKDKRFEAKGVDPQTGKRKSFYSRISQEDADRKARKSFGIQIGRGFTSYYKSAFIPAIVHRSLNWRLQVAWAMDNVWKPVFADKELDEIGRADVQAAVNAANLRYKPKSVQNAYKVLHALFELAEADEMIARNPCLKIRLAPVGESDRKALTFEQLALLIKHSHDLVKPFILLSGCCSLRRGEACAVQWSDFDNLRSEGAGLLKVQRQIIQVAGICDPTGQLKTPQSYRTIPIPKGLKEALLGCNQFSAVWTCSDTHGGFLRPQNVRREVGLACKRAGLGHWEGEGEERKFVALISPHELRHTFVSLMENDLEVPRRVVEAISGKGASGKIGTYSHADIKQMERAMGRLWDRIVSELSDDQARTIKIG